MAERLRALLGSRAAGITAETFHAFGANLLRQYGARIGLDPDFAICGEEDRAMILRLACPDLPRGEVQPLSLIHISEPTRPY